MPQGDKSSYTDKQKRQAVHIEQNYEKRGVAKGEAERRAWSTSQRHFCGKCGAALWIRDPEWPDLVHPHAGAIDTRLPEPPANVHCALSSKASWVRVEGKAGDERYDTFPSYSMKEWHQRHAPQDPTAQRPA